MSVRYDFYQTDSNVVVSVMLKNAKEHNYNVNIETDKLTVTADNCHLEIHLYHPIIVEKSSHRATPTKIEIALSKVTSERWPTLERKAPEETKKAVPVPTFGTHNWDKIAKEIASAETEEAKEEEALQNLFQKIYSESSDEVRRAMNKSFSESGGTVLSTNWQEVAKGKVDAKPPDGTEYRNWEC
ncbi:unnamed protein product [Hermetia illucens]|uniref:Uncharacterized protein n=1 Tax=Hermetia illucens TaxID=343691 RepID=A0A7R8YLB9_HERIL|nr:protein SGT1 homolog [Hermetia illucens]CAD7077385.1 unnamed protein product [Hermetia illucens]